MSKSEALSHVEEELTAFLPSSATVRALQALLGALPQGGTLAWFPSIDAAVPSEDPETVAAIREAVSTDEVGQVLAVAQALDRGDRSLFGGVRSVFSGLFGGGANPQRADAAIKARALAFVIGRLAGNDVERVLASPAVRPLVHYYALGDIAVPLGAEAEDHGEGFVASLVASDRPSDWGRLRSVVKDPGVTVARAVLPQLVTRLDRAVTEVLPHAATVQAQIEAVLPGASAGASLAGLGLDALDAYRWLTARFVVELELERRGLAAQVTSATPPPPPPPFPGPDAGPRDPDSTLVPNLDEEGEELAANPFAEPSHPTLAPTRDSDRDTEPPNPFADPEPEPSNPFADPEPSNPFASEPAPEPANPFAPPAPSVAEAPASTNPFADPEPPSPFADPEPPNPFADPEPDVQWEAPPPPPASGNPFAPVSSASPPSSSPTDATAGNPFAPRRASSQARPSAMDVPEPPNPFDPPDVPPPLVSANPFAPASSVPGGEPPPDIVPGGNPFAATRMDATNPFALPDDAPATPGADAPPIPFTSGPETSGNPFAPASSAAPIVAPPLQGEGNPFLPPSAPPSTDAASDRPVPPPTEPVPFANPSPAPAAPNPFAAPTGLAEAIAVVAGPLAAAASALLGGGDAFRSVISPDPAPPSPAPSGNPFAESPQPAPAPTADVANPFADPEPVAAEPPNPFGDPAPVAAADVPNPFADPAPAATDVPNPFADPTPVASEAPNPFADPAPAADVPNPFADPEPAEVPNPFADAGTAEPEPPANPFTAPAIHPATGLMDRDLKPNPLELGRDDATEESAPILVPPAPTDAPEGGPEPGRPNPDVTMSEDAPPVPPPSLHPQWPTQELPESRRLRGVFRSPDGLWRIFTKEGIFTDAPPARPEPIDWDAHWGKGHRVAVYRRDADQATIEYFDAPPVSFSIKREPYTLKMDGVPWRRADYDLTKRTMQGRWIRDDGEVLTLDHGGRITLGNDQGSYRLGVARMDVTWPDREEAISLFSTLAPSSKHPQWLWLGGRAYRRQVTGSR